MSDFPFHDAEKEWASVLRHDRQRYYGSPLFIYLVAPTTADFSRFVLRRLCELDIDITAPLGPGRSLHEVPGKHLSHGTVGFHDACMAASFIDPRSSQPLSPLPEERMWSRAVVRSAEREGDQPRQDWREEKEEDRLAKIRESLRRSEEIGRESKDQIAELVRRSA